MQDITKDILNRKELAGVIPQSLSNNVVPAERDPDFYIDDPIFIIAKANAMDDYHVFVFVDTPDERIKGIFWKRDELSKSLGFIKNTRTNKVQYYENNKMVKQFNQFSERVDKEIAKKVSEFKSKYSQGPDKFDVYASRKASEILQQKN